MKKNYIWIIVGVVVILGGFLIWQIEKPGSIEYAQNSNGKNSEDSIQKNSEIITPSPTQAPETVQKNTAAKLSYGDAIKKYQYRIQFKDCHGNPGSISLKRNVALMLDNRDAKAHTIKVAGKSFYIKGYDYSLAYIGTEGTHNLTCDGGGSASVNIEK